MAHTIATALDQALIGRYASQHGVAAAAVLKEDEV